jgi:hypothetical protein
MSKKRRGRPLKQIDGEVVRQLAMIGCTNETIAEHFHVHRHTIENRFEYELEEGRSDGHIRLKGKAFKAAMDGNMRALELCLVNQCGWTLRPDISVVTNVVQNNQQPQKSPEEVKAHLVMLQRAVLEECRKYDEPQQLPPASS